MRILQVCNVGRIVGGTAACAWSIARAFPEAEHHVAFLSTIVEETRAAFQHATVHRCSRITNDFVRAIRADCVILHNTAPQRCERIVSAWTLQYVHSRGVRAPADSTVYCSRWLARECEAPTAKVLLQSVPRPVGSYQRTPIGDLVVGRICTPTSAKWPGQLVEFYRHLAGLHPAVRWEFVGCPVGLRFSLEQACRGRTAFHEAAWEARSHLTRWDVLLYHQPTLTESFGRTVAEAMRAGCVPVVDRRGGFCEQVTGSTGFLCRSAEEFSGALAELSCLERRQRMSEAATEHAEAVFSLAAFRKRLLSVWRSARFRQRA